MAKEPNPTDILVGENIRLKRSLLGLSQSSLADELGITFQQVQKYEKGANRIGASRLEHIAKVLKVTPSFFFQNSSTIGKTAQEESWAYDPDLKRMIAFLDTPEGTKLVSNFMRITDPALRERIVELVVGIGNIKPVALPEPDTEGLIGTSVPQDLPPKD